MKKAMFVVMCVVAVALVGCAAETSSIDDTEASQEALTRTSGHCQIGTNGLLTGKCLSVSLTCVAATSTLCPSGATPVSASTIYSGLCSPNLQSWDTGRTCYNY